VRKGDREKNILNCETDKEVKQDQELQSGECEQNCNLSIRKREGEKGSK
jgi:hypothetical protein